MARSNEPFFWALFSAGGVMTAFLLPVQLLIFGILWPLGVIPEGTLSYERLHGIVTHPVGRLYLFALVSLALFHAAHRLRFALADLGLKPVARPLAIACYGGAFAGTLACAVMLVGL